MFLIKVFLMSMMPFWRVELPPEAYNLGPEIQIVSYKNGSEFQRVQFVKSDPEYQQIIDYLSQSGKIWKYNVATYVPRTLIRGNGITLNCFNNSSVINFKDQIGNLIQLSSDPVLVSNCGLKVFER